MMPVQLPPPPDDTEAAIMRLVVREFPDGGPGHERAIRMALRLGWSAAIGARNELQERLNG